MSKHKNNLCLSKPLISVAASLTQTMYNETLHTWEKKGKKYPSASYLRGNQHTFGSPSSDHSYLKEPVFSNIVIHVIKSRFIPWCDFITSLHPVCHLTQQLWNALVNKQNDTFKVLALDYVHWKEQTIISHKRVDTFLTAALHYNLDLGSVIRFCSGRYTASFRDTDQVLERLTQADASPKLLLEIKHLFDKGCPTHFNASSRHENFVEFLNHGNHITVADNIDKS